MFAAPATSFGVNVFYTVYNHGATCGDPEGTGDLDPPPPHPWKFTKLYVFLAEKSQIF